MKYWIKDKTVIIQKNDIYTLHIYRENMMVVLRSIYYNFQIFQIFKL